MTEQTVIAAADRATEAADRAASATSRLRSALTQAIDAVHTHVGHRPTIDHLLAFADSDPATVQIRAELREVKSFLLVEAPKTALDAIIAIEQALAATRLPLTCPDCGGPLFISTETRGQQYLTYEAPALIECDDYRCGAEWLPDGTLPAKDES